MADGGEGGRGGGGRRGGGCGLHRSRSSRRPTVVTTALVIEYDNGMAVSFRTMGQESAVMRQLRSVMTELTSELEEAGDWHLHTISGGPRDGVYRGHASGDSDGGVTPVRDAGGRGGARRRRRRMHSCRCSGCRQATAVLTTSQSRHAQDRVAATSATSRTASLVSAVAAAEIHFGGATVHNAIKSRGGRPESVPLSCPGGQACDVASWRISWRIPWRICAASSVPESPGSGLFLSLGSGLFLCSRFCAGWKCSE